MSFIQDEDRPGAVAVGLLVAAVLTVLAAWCDGRAHAATLSLPNLTLTPGVARSLTVEEICSIRWGRDRRFVTLKMKQQVFRAYGIPWSRHQRYEVDHLIPRELGGADDVQNLWPQPWPEAHQKDRDENAAHHLVCSEVITLADAQRQMVQWGREPEP